MGNPVTLVELWRGGIFESAHQGHAVICDGSGQIIDAWGDPDMVIFPRSSCKMVQALPLIESGAADAFGLSDADLALACASHSAAHIHTDRVREWIAALDYSDADFRCGPAMPADIEARNDLIKTDSSPCQYHNECSGKHSGFLTVVKHLKAGPEYVEVDHPLQKAFRQSFEDVTQQDSPGFGLDGCSAPNFATTVHGLARAMAFYATAQDRNDLRSQAAARLTQAMTAFPEMVAGKAQSSTDLMQAMDGKVAVKSGAEGVFIAIIPEKRIGVALKITDGAGRARDCVIADILVRLGVLDPMHPTAIKYRNPRILNRNGWDTGEMRPVMD
ncbi:asparaginase [Octadecabacter sp. R77987]|uniref:asparaginase n=1 Tax=Octadecabacter sp. R77987 TaxID=3093874 RepID=UPI0036725307